MATVNSDALTNPIIQRMKDTIAQTKSDVKANKDKAEEEYAVVFEQYQKMCEQKDAVYTQLKYNPTDPTLKKQYAAADSSVFSADTAWTCARYKVEDSLSLYSKIG